MGPIGCLETLVRNYHSTLRNIPEDRRLIVLSEKGTRGCVSRWDLLSRSEPANSWYKMTGVFRFVSVGVEHDTLNIRPSPTEDLDGVKLGPYILHKHAFRIISFVKVFGRYLIFSFRFIFQLLANLISERVKSMNT